jgi:chorismate synthase
MGLRFLTAGESHGPGLVAVLEGVPSGLHLTEEIVSRDLERRQRGSGGGPRMKIERDRARIVGGVMEGVTIGAPLALFIENRDHEKWRNRSIRSFTIPRPGHADLAAALKYGYRDLRPGLERASARETAARVAVGAVCRELLGQFDVRVGGYVTAIGEVTADVSNIPLEQRAALAEQNDVRCPDSKASHAMSDFIRLTMKNRDTAGGIIEVIVLNLPPGLGSHVHWDRRLEGRLGAAVLSIPAIKGVEIGPAFETARLPGTQAQDPIRLVGESLVRPSVLSGGLEGGITTGQPLVVRAAMKPIATTLTQQQTVDLAREEETVTEYERSDFCPVPRAVVIVEAMVAFVLADALLEKLGGDSLDEMRPRFEAVSRGRLGDLSIAHDEYIYWPQD